MNQEDMQIIGTLALEKDTKRKGVFINTKSAIQYVVKSMMSDYKSDKLFTGYMNSFENDQKFDDEYRSDEERVEKFWDHIYDELFIYNFKANDGEFERMTKVHLVNKPVKFNEDEYFKGVPVFSAATDEIVREWELESQWSLYRNYNTLDEFCDCIKAKQPLGSTYGYDATESQPSFVIWKNQNQKLYVIGKIANCRYNSQRGLILEKEGQELSLVEIHLKTGRHHQIRVQFAGHGYPLWADARYGTAVPRQNVALSSCGLAFEHPVTGKWMEFSMEPEGMIFRKFTKKFFV